MGKGDVYRVKAIMKPYRKEEEKLLTGKSLCIINLEEAFEGKILS